MNVWLLRPALGAGGVEYEVWLLGLGEVGVEYEVWLLRPALGTGVVEYKVWLLRPGGWRRSTGVRVKRSTRASCHV